jgi:release factor glutamine methyltransferase
VIAPPAGQSVRAVLAEVRGALASAGIDDAALEARLLLREATGRSWSTVLARPEAEVAPGEARRLARMVDRRLRREPFAYVVGHTSFRGLRLSIDRRVLVPRPETELLAGLAIDRCERGGVVIDVGTGSGAVALAVAAERADVTVIGCDVSGDALSVAVANARALGLSSRVSFVQADLLSAARAGRYVVVANLPYVPSGEIASAQAELAWEPALALAGGPDGMDVYRRLLAQTTEVVAGGTVAFEIGAGQAAAAREIAAHAFPRGGISVQHDFAGIERVVVVEL